MKRKKSIRKTDTKTDEMLALAAALAVADEDEDEEDIIMIASIIEDL